MNFWNGPNTNSSIENLVQWWNIAQRHENSPNKTHSEKKLVLLWNKLSNPKSLNSRGWYEISFRLQCNFSTYIDKMCSRTGFNTNSSVRNLNTIMEMSWGLKNRSNTTPLRYLSSNYRAISILLFYVLGKIMEEINHSTIFEYLNGKN